MQGRESLQQSRRSARLAANGLVRNLFPKKKTASSSVRSGRRIMGATKCTISYKP